MLACLTSGASPASEAPKTLDFTICPSSTPFPWMESFGLSLNVYMSPVSRHPHCWHFRSFHRCITHFHLALSSRISLYYTDRRQEEEAQAPNISNHRRRPSDFTTQKRMTLALQDSYPFFSIILESPFTGVEGAYFPSHFDYIILPTGEASYSSWRPLTSKS